MASCQGSLVIDRMNKHGYNMIKDQAHENATQVLVDAFVILMQPCTEDDMEVCQKNIGGV